jgi:hypothetical protein
MAVAIMLIKRGLNFVKASVARNVHYPETRIAFVAMLRFWRESVDLSKLPAPFHFGPMAFWAASSALLY